VARGDQTQANPKLKEPLMNARTALLSAAILSALALIASGASASTEGSAPLPAGAPRTGGHA